MSENTIKKHDSPHGSGTPPRKQSNQTPVLGATGAPVLDPPPSPASTNNSAHEKRQRFKRFKDYAELVGIATLVVYTAFAGEQSCATRQSADAAASAAETAVKALYDSEDSFIDTLTQMQAQTRAQERSAANTLQSLNASQDNFRKDQRAWLGTSNVVVRAFNSKAVDIYVEITNTGKTPALNITQKFSLINRQKSLDAPPPDWITDHAFTYTGSINPQGQRKAPLVASGDDAAMLVKTLNAGWFIYVFGEIRYKDVYGIPHVTTMCGKLDKTSATEQTLEYCNYYNEMN